MATVVSAKYVKKCFRITRQPCHNGTVIPRLPRVLRFVASAMAIAVVVTQASASTEAVSAVAPRQLSNGQETLFFVGDSLTVGTQAFGQLQKRLEQTGIWNRVAIDARVGRRSDQSLKVLENKMPAATTAIVIALGTNDVISRREASYPSWVINRVMESSRGLPVLWFNTEFSPTGRGDWRFRSRRFNRALREAQNDWSNLIIADWYNFFTPKGKVRFQSDGVHLSVSAYKLRAVFTESQIRNFGTEIVNATTTTSTTTTTTTEPPLTTTVAPSTSTTTSSTTSTTTTSTTTTSLAPSP